MRPRLTTGLPFSLTHTHGCAWLQAHSRCLLRMHHTLNPSPAQHPLEDFSAEGRCPRIAFRFTQSLPMSALLPEGDESAMNLECLGGLFQHIRCFPQQFFELGVNFADKGWPGQLGPKKPHRAGPRRLAYGTAWRGMGDRRVASPILRRSAWASRATAAGVGDFSLLAVLVYVADEYPACEAGAGTLKASVVRL